jgi:tetratricopeptide (TPR) repeat protein
MTERFVQSVVRSLFVLALLAGSGTALALPSMRKELADDPEAILHQANEALRERSFLRAEQLAHQALQIDGQPMEHWKAWAIIGMSRQVRLRYASALEAYRKCLDHLPPEGRELGMMLREQMDRCRDELRREPAPTTTSELTARQQERLGEVEPYWTTFHHGPYTVHTRNEDLSRLMGRLVADHVRRIRRELGLAEAELPLKLTIRVWPDPHDYRQAVPHAPEHGQGCTIATGSPGSRVVLVDLIQRDAAGQFSAALLDQALPHELTHVLLTTYLGRQARNLPLAIQEGLAMLCETVENPGRFFLAATALADPQRKIPLDELLDIEHYDQAPEPELFYAESYALAEFLRSRLDLEQFTRFLAGIRTGFSARDSLREALGKQTGPEFLRELEIEWKRRTFLQAEILQTLQQADPAEPTSL